jgi:hypothetical protein
MAYVDRYNVFFSCLFVFTFFRFFTEFDSLSSGFIFWLFCILFLSKNQTKQNAMGGSICSRTVTTVDKGCQVDLESQCIICYNHQRIMLFAPCNHLVMCESCYNQYLKKTTCPICQQEKVKAVKIYYS